MVDALMYEYTSGSPSLLTSVTETEEAEKGFKGTTALYSYDGTGNMTYASNKALSMIYSYHDMPLQLNTPNGKVQNYYTASGMKIKSVLLPNNMTLSDGPTITNYFDNIEYENSEVKAVYFDEGRAVTSKEGDYIEYFLKDHLGNTRVRISDKDQNNKVHYNVNDPANDEVMSSHHYYPFGMEWDMPSFDINGNSLASAGKDTEYTYNGKEFQDDLGIDLHYYGFRVYDPAIGRFTSVDPIAERFAFVSGFNYAENEPIANIDLHGLQKIRYDVAWSDPGLVAVGATHAETRQFQKVSGETTGLALLAVVPGPEDVVIAGVAATRVGGAVLKAVGKYADEAFGYVKGLFRSSDEIGDIAIGISKTIHEGKQGKHIPGHNNFQEGKSELTGDAQSLLDDLQGGNVNSAQKINDDKTRVDFGKEIGNYVNPDTGTKTPTSVGTVINSKSGAHIVPAKPKID